MNYHITQLERKIFSDRSDYFSLKHRRTPSFSINLSEIHDILKKNLSNKQVPSQTHRRSTSQVSKYRIKIIPSSRKQKVPLSIFKPLEIRCKSPSLKLKFSKPKLLHLTNNFIVTKLPNKKKHSLDNK